MKKTIKAIKKKIKKTDSFLIIAHKNPDHDAWGSLYFMVNYLNNKNKKVYWNIKTPISSIYDKMFNDIYRFRHHGEKFQCLITLDSANMKRTGYSMDEHFTINLDHHVSNSRYGNLNLVRPDLSSTCEVLYKALWEKRFYSSEKFKKAILLGILGDTGFLKYDNATRDTFNAVSKLIDGINIFDIYKEFNRMLTRDQLVFLTDMIHLLKQKGKIYYIALDNETLVNSKLLYEDISNLFKIFRGIRDADTIILIREVEKGTVRVNFRGNSTLDLNKVAAYFKGGGHANAAACTIRGPFSESVNSVIEITKKYSNEEK
ncbi:DHH family phosphoesterase [bacterium]|nr:DHH family phosphoesterase [bacterium]